MVHAFAASVLVLAVVVVLPGPDVAVVTRSARSAGRPISMSVPQPAAVPGRRGGQGS